MAARKIRETPPQLLNEADRACLRNYLTDRLRDIGRDLKKCGEQCDANFYEGAQMEIVFLFDELLREQVPDLRKVKKGN